MELKGRGAIITGGSRGIGKAVAEKFLREGASVAIFARNKKEIAMSVKELSMIAPNRILGVSVDVANFVSVKKAMARVAKQFKKIDVLVNAAGIQRPIESFAESSIEDWKSNIRINLFGTVHAVKAVLPIMMKQRSGSIINFSGGGATSSRPNFSAYAVAKIGVVKFTEILADELAPFHIRVNAIAPGAVNTAMLKEVLRMGEKVGKRELASARKRAKEGGVPPGLPADLVAFLASQKSAPLSGRLISAPWDDWKHWDKKKIAKIQSTDQFTLRRK